MRAASSGKPAFTQFEEDGPIVGVSLGYDHCAEHEWGIKGLKQAFGIPAGPTRECLGIQARTITTVPAGLSTFNVQHQFTDWSGPKKKIVTIDLLVLAYDRSLQPEYPYNPLKDEKSAKDWVSHCLQLYGADHGIWAAWDESSFMIAVDASKYQEALTEIHDAFKAKTISVGQLKQMNPFAGSGLTFLLNDKVPAEYDEATRMSDTEHLDLDEYVASTGIKKILEDAGCRYFALSPRYCIHQETGERIVQFWLNPMEQKQNNYGWFTLEDLQAWAKGEGPIPMKK